MADENLDLNFKGGNPGAVKHGNFINYYKFHPPENRLSLLPNDIWKISDENAFVCLDIGCNTGDLTKSLHNFLKLNMSPNNEKCKILGIDIDPALIERAKEAHASSSLTFKCTDFMKNSDLLLSYLSECSKTKFDAVFCFSVTMWIHLNYGDDGLHRFLQKMCSITELVVIEPQPWKCYRAAVKRLRTSGEEFPLFPELKVRGNVGSEIERMLNKNGFCKVTETDATKWQRKILIFKACANV